VISKGLLGLTNIAPYVAQHCVEEILALQELA
jgi:hypothetical protein